MKDELRVGDLRGWGHLETSFLIIKIKGESIYFRYIQKSDRTLYMRDKKDIVSHTKLLSTLYHGEL